MSTQPERIMAVELFKEIKKQTKADDVACAILVVGDVLGDLRHKLGHLLAVGGLEHEICLGIRQGLFGTGADSNESLHSVAGPLSDIAKAIQDRDSD